MAGVSGLDGPQFSPADSADIPDGMSIPHELARREERLRKLVEARAKIEARAKERHAREGTVKANQNRRFSASNLAERVDDS
jgi:hypothetical protein